MRRRRNPEIISGRVNSDGTIQAGEGFVAIRTSTGTYAILFPSSFRLVGVTASVINAVGDADPNSFSPNGVTISTFTMASALSDMSFSFVAVGAQQ